MSVMEFSVTCKNCGKQFQASRSTAHFCSDSCRVAFNRKMEDKKEEVISQVAALTEKKGDADVSKEVSSDAPETTLPSGGEFIPNWQRLGFGSQEEAVASVLKALAKRSGEMKEGGLGTFIIRGAVIDLGSAWVEKKKKK